MPMQDNKNGHIVSLFTFATDELFKDTHAKVMTNGCNVRNVNVEPHPPKDRPGTRVSFSRCICNSRNRNPQWGVGREPSGRSLLSSGLGALCISLICQPPPSAQRRQGSLTRAGGQPFQTMIPVTNDGSGCWPFSTWVIMEREG